MNCFVIKMDLLEVLIRFRPLAGMNCFAGRKHHLGHGPVSVPSRGKLFQNMSAREKLKYTFSSPCGGELFRYLDDAKRNGVKSFPSPRRDDLFLHEEQTPEGFVRFSSPCGDKLFLDCHIPHNTPVRFRPLAGVSGFSRRRLAKHLQLEISVPSRG